jgi:hypothetical protein
MRQGEKINLNDANECDINSPLNSQETTSRIFPPCGEDKGGGIYLA